MKKILVIALVVVMALGVVAFAACDNGTTYTGKCWYSSQWGAYGCMVDVTVKGDTIVSVKLYTDEEAAAADSEWAGAHRTTLTWGTGEDQHQNEGDLGHDGAEAAYAKWISDTFVGKTVAEVKAYSADKDAWTISDGAKLAGATQSAVRIVLAVQDALAKIPAAK